MLPIPAILVFAFVVSSNAVELDVVDRGVMDLILPRDEAVLPKRPFYIRADNGKYVTRTRWWDKFEATAETPKKQESGFKADRVDGKLYLVNVLYDKYLCVTTHFDGAVRTIDQRDAYYMSTCHLEAVKNDDGTVSFKYLYNNKYMCRVNNEIDQSSIKANKNKIESTCKFTIKEVE